VTTPATADLERLAAVLNGDARVTTLCGSGFAGGRDELLAIGERLKALMVHTVRSKEHVEGDNPYDVGMTGLIGFSSGYYAILDCGVLLMLGTDFGIEGLLPHAVETLDRQVERVLGQPSASAPSGCCPLCCCFCAVCGDPGGLTPGVLERLLSERYQVERRRLEVRVQRLLFRLQRLVLGQRQESLEHPLRLQQLLLLFLW